MKVISNLLGCLPDKAYLRIMYKRKTGKTLHLKNPKTFNEKLQWLKLNDRNPEYIKIVDKHMAKEYVANIIGERYIIPTYSVYNHFDEIDFDLLPNQFVMKCTHDSGGVLIVRDKEQLDISKAKKRIEQNLKRDYYKAGREWPYKNVKPKIIVEKYMDSLTNEKNGLTDYKFMCFNGEVKCCFTCTERYSKTGLKVTFFDNDWKEMPFERHYPKSSVPIHRPDQYDEMREISERLSKGMKFVRVDLYVIQKNVYFGELTLYPGCGFETFSPEEWDLKLGNWLKI